MDYLRQNFYVFTIAIGLLQGSISAAVALVTVVVGLEIGTYSLLTIISYLLSLNINYYYYYY